jgi:hypothetical protein
MMIDGARVGANEDKEGAVMGIAPTGTGLRVEDAP